MKTFLQYLLEGYTNPDKINIRKLIYPALIKSKIKFSKSNRATNEIFRADLGKSEEEARKVVEPITNSANIKLGEYSIFGRPQASGTYQSFEVDYKGHKYYITNTQSGNGVLHNKDLVPNKVLKNIDEEFTSFKQLVNNIDLSKIKEPSIVEVLKALIESVDLNNVVEKNGFFESKDFNTAISTEHSNSKLIIQANAKLEELLKTIDNADVLNISKDFGEVILPLIFFKSFKDVSSVRFPTGSNELLIDYYVNGIQFSAKSSGGGAPSGVKIFLKASKDIKEYPDKYTKDELKCINALNEIYSKDSFLALKFMIENYAYKMFPKLKEVLNRVDFNSFNTQEDLASSLDKLDKDNRTDFFNEVYDMINYHPERFKTGMTPYDLYTITKNWDNYNSKLKLGILFYPLYVISVKQMNTMYSDLLTSIISKTIDMMQCYFDIKKNVLLFKLFKALTSKWKFTVGGISTANINNAKLSIKMLKS